MNNPQIENQIEWPTAPPNPVEKPVCPADLDAIPKDELIKLYSQTVRWQHQELLRKNYEIRELRDRMAAFHDELRVVRNGQPRSAYEVLLLLANDPTQSAATRLRAAEACIAFERPKLSATMSHNTNITDIGSRMDEARRRIAANKPIWPAEVTLPSPDSPQQV